MYRIIFLFSFVCTCCYADAQEKKYIFTETKMGSPFNIILVTDDSMKASALARKCFALIDSFNHIFSDYDANSELNRLNAVAGISKQKVSPALLDIISCSKTAWQKSKAAFDITIGPLSQLWRKARKEKQFPAAAWVEEKRKLVGFSKMELDSAYQTVFLSKPSMRLDLGGIAKGYVAQKIIDFLTQNGITMALADAGGDMVMSGAPVNSSGWTVGVNIPESPDDLFPKRLLLENIAIATSGDAYQYIEHNGLRYSHIIDPRTGYGITSQRNTTVIARNGTDADWLATACSILTIEEAKQLALSMHAELLIAELKDGKVIFHETAGFKKYWKP